MNEPSATPLAFAALPDGVVSAPGDKPIPTGPVECERCDYEECIGTCGEPPDLPPGYRPPPHVADGGCRRADALRDGILRALASVDARREAPPKVPRGIPGAWRMGITGPGVWLARSRGGSGPEAAAPAYEIVIIVEVTPGRLMRLAPGHRWDRFDRAIHAPETVYLWIETIETALRTTGWQLRGDVRTADRAEGRRLALKRVIEDLRATELEALHAFADALEAERRSTDAG